MFPDQVKQEISSSYVLSIIISVKDSIALSFDTENMRAKCFIYSHSFEEVNESISQETAILKGRFRKREREREASKEDAKYR